MMTMEKIAASQIQIDIDAMASWSGVELSGAEWHKHSAGDRALHLHRDCDLGRWMSSIYPSCQEAGGWMWEVSVLIVGTEDFYVRLSGVAPDAEQAAAAALAHPIEVKEIDGLRFMPDEGDWKARLGNDFVTVRHWCRDGKEGWRWEREVADAKDVLGVLNLLPWHRIMAGDAATFEDAVAAARAAPDVLLGACLKFVGAALAIGKLEIR